MQLSTEQSHGYALVIVMGFVAVLSVLLSAVMLYSSTQMRIARSQADNESALYLAQAGAERAAAYVANGGDGPWSTGGTNAQGACVVAVIPSGMLSESPRTISGWINLHPNGEPGQGGNDFALRLPDGTMIDHYDLNQDAQDYVGPAVWVHFRAGGSGQQIGLVVDGAPYPLQHNYTYEIFAGSMHVNLYNNNRNPQGKAVGKWHLAIATACASLIVTD